MSRHYYDVARSQTGLALPSATVTVYDAGTTTKSSIFSDSALSSAKANPFTTDSLGEFDFWTGSDFHKISIYKDGYDAWEVDDILIAQQSQYTDARDYGITAAASAASNDAALASIMTAFRAAGGGALYLMEIIPVTTKLFPPKNTTIFAHSWEGGFHMETADTPILQVQGDDGVNNSGVRIEGLRLTGQGGYTTPGLGAITIGLGGANTGADDCIVRGCWLDGVSNCGITVGSKSNRTLIEGNFIEGAGEEGIYDLGADTIVRGNISRGNGEAGIKCHAELGGAILQGNQCLSNGQQGILVNDCFNVLVDANYCRDNGFEGVVLSAGAGNTLSDVSVVNNHCIANGQDADNTRSNIKVVVNGGAVSDVYVSGNVCRHGGGAIQPKYGLEIGAGVVDTVVGVNDLRDGGKTGQYLNAGTNTQTPFVPAQLVAATSNTSITSTSPTDIPGATITVTPILNQKVVVSACFGVERVVAGALTCGLHVNGVGEPGTAVTNIAGRSMISQTWVISLVGGTTYTIKLIALVAAGADWTIHGGNTQFSIAPVHQE